jgi:formylglycine-generating enzyme required for sulfatase activity
MDCLNWYEAFAFCIWDGGRLPTEAEWNYVAAAGSEQRFYPWSSPPSSTQINLLYSEYCQTPWNQPFDPLVQTIDKYQLDTTVPWHCTDATLPQPISVGSSPRNYGMGGVADLAGNAAEWMLDAYLPSRNEQPPCTQPDPMKCMAPNCNDCVELGVGTPSPPRVVRGGAWLGPTSPSQYSMLRNDWRQGFGASNRSIALGFRCARDVD